MALNPALQKLINKKAGQYKGGSGNTIKPKEGANRYRLIAPKFSDAPWVGESEQFWADLGVHWIKADENGKPLVVLGDCDTVYQQPSVINSAIDMAISSAIDEDSKKLYESWKATRRVIVNVVDRSDDDTHILELTPTTFGKVLDMIGLYAAEGIDITDPENGYDIVISRSGKALNTSYDVAVAPMVPGKPFKKVTKEQMAKADDLPAFIERQFFRGEEQKALNCIAQIAGIAVPAMTSTPALSSHVSTPTAALSSPSAAVADASGPTAEELAKAKTEADAQKAANDELEARRKMILERQARELAELEAASKPAASKPAASEAPVVEDAQSEGMADLSQDEQDKILAELDSLTGN